MEYLSLIFGFLAVAVSVRGNTWDKHKSGFYKVTGTGWAALSIALLSSVIAGHGIYAQNLARQTIQKYSRHYVKSALSEMLSPFWGLHMNYQSYLGRLDKARVSEINRALALGRKHDPRGGFDVMRRIIPISSLSEPGFTEFLQTRDLTIGYTHITKMGMKQSLEIVAASHNLVDGISRIRTLLTTFRDELELPVRSSLLDIIDPEGFAESLRYYKDTLRPSKTILSKKEPHLFKYRKFIKACAQISNLLPDEIE